MGKSSLLRKEVKLKMTELPHVNVYAKLKMTELPHVSVYAFKLNHMNPYLRKGHFMTEIQYLDHILQFDQESTVVFVPNMDDYNQNYLLILLGAIRFSGFYKHSSYQYRI